MSRQSERQRYKEIKVQYPKFGEVMSPPALELDEVTNESDETFTMRGAVEVIEENLALQALQAQKPEEL